MPAGAGDLRGSLSVLDCRLPVVSPAVHGVCALNGDELEWTINGDTTKSKVKVDATELELTSEGQTIKYKRM